MIRVAVVQAAPVFLDLEASVAKCLGLLRDDEEAALLADLDPEAIDREVMTLDVSGHDSRPDVFRFEVERRRM